MRNRTAAALLLLGSASPVLAQVPAGGEFQVNSHTTGVQSRASAASDPSGNLVVAWESAGQDGSSLAIIARRYDASGAPLGAEFRVNTHTTGAQSQPALAADARGNFVIVWQSDQDGSGSGIFGQLFDRSGAPRGTEFQINTYVTSNQSSPSIASSPAGSFVVVWDSEGQDGSSAGMFAQRHAASGAKLGSEFRVNSYTPARQYDGAVTVDAAGNFIVAWTSVGQDDALPGVFAQRYDAVGAPLGSEFQVNTSTWFWQYRASIASDPEGDFVIAWTWRDYVGGPGPLQFPTRIMARRYNSAGAPQSPEFQVSPFTLRAFPQPASAVRSDAAGNFVVTWDGSPYPVPPPTLSPVVGRRYDASGNPRGPAFPVNSSPPDNASKAVSIGADGAGNFVVVWDNTQDGSGKGVFAQRFGGIVPSALAVDTAAAGSNGNRVLEPGESVDVRPSWRNVNGAAQTFDGAGLGFSGPAAGGVSYQLSDAVGAYGVVPDGSTATCADCYRVGVAFSGTRPASHWDATFTERLTPDVLGQTKPWPIHVGESFVDVPATSPYYRFVETLLHEGVTAGCANGAYCPGAPTTREQMAAFVLLAEGGAGYAPVPCTQPNLFGDVPETSIFCDVIEELARRGIVSGCGGGNYCPTSAVTREQMAVFVLRTLDPALSPPPCTTPVFTDVPASSPFCPWIEELARRGVVAGCGGGNYCPTSPVTREQMAVFLSGTFGLSLYGP